MTHTTWGAMEIIDGVLSVFNKSENHNLDRIYTPWERIKTTDGWPFSYEKYKLGLDEHGTKYFKHIKTFAGKFIYHVYNIFLAAKQRLYIL